MCASMRQVQHTCRHNYKRKRYRALPILCVKLFAQHCVTQANGLEQKLPRSHATQQGSQHISVSGLKKDLAKFCAWSEHAPAEILV
jgi:hypothetical protein